MKWTRIHKLKFADRTAHRSPLQLCRFWFRSFEEWSTGDQGECKSQIEILDSRFSASFLVEFSRLFYLLKFLRESNSPPDFHYWPSVGHLQSNETEKMLINPELKWLLKKTREIKRIINCAQCFVFVFGTSETMFSFSNTALRIPVRTSAGIALQRCREK